VSRRKPKQIISVSGLCSTIMFNGRRQLVTQVNAVDLLNLCSGVMLSDSESPSVIEAEQRCVNYFSGDEPYRGLPAITIRLCEIVGLNIDSIDILEFQPSDVIVIDGQDFITAFSNICNAFDTRLHEDDMEDSAFIEDDILSLTLQKRLEYRSVMKALDIVVIFVFDSEVSA
jgi:hypothetical protein